jgi:DNA-binding transcriptional MerR regulator
MIMTEKHYTIEELSQITGFSRRTIRYYIAEGLLEPPAGRGRGGFYFDSHVETLTRIRTLRNGGVRLSAVAEMLSGGGAVRVPSERALWIRYEIEPGLEIHVERGLEERRRGDLEEVVRVARSILTKGVGDNG